MALITRRTVVFSLAVASIGASARSAETAWQMTIHKDPSCGCCSSWIEHLRGAGFETKINDVADLAPVKRRLAIPASLASCHTAEVDTFLVEGHVPAPAIRRLLIERPDARGLAVPGMPVRSPGMEVPGEPGETYEVILFSSQGQSVFARYRGMQEIKVRL